MNFRSKQSDNQSVHYSQARKPHSLSICRCKAQNVTARVQHTSGAGNDEVGSRIRRSGDGSNPSFVSGKFSALNKFFSHRETDGWITSVWRILCATTATLAGGGLTDEGGGAPLQKAETLFGGTEAYNLIEKEKTN